MKEVKQPETVMRKLEKKNVSHAHTKVSREQAIVSHGHAKVFVIFIFANVPLGSL